jgi:hypothetical protein
MVICTMIIPSKAMGFYLKISDNLKSLAVELYMWPQISVGPECD